MSIHLNSDGSQTDGVKVEPWGKFASHRLVCSRRCAAHCAGWRQSGRRAGGRWRDDCGALHIRRHHADNHPAGQSITSSAADAAAAKFIGATGATVNAVYTL